MSLTLPSEPTTNLTDQSCLSKKVYKTTHIGYRSRFFNISNSGWICNHWTSRNYRLKFWIFFIKCARFALKCDLPRIFRGMMMHKLEILSMSYFRASDIEATNIYHLLLVFREIDTCAQSAQLIKLIYNLQENHIPTYFFGQGQASAKQCVQKWCEFLVHRKIHPYAFSARSLTIFLRFFAHSFLKLGTQDHESVNNLFNANVGFKMRWMNEM